MVGLEEKKLMIRIIIDFLKRAKESKDNDDKELRVKYAICCFNFFEEDIYFSILTREAVRNIENKQETSVKDIDNLIEELKIDYTIQDVI